ncbi:replication protein [Lacticaseibacillus paracasei]|uniref:replication protein n=1 Tax=Lacticaseibacillus paracasei TaxID=1597 RepID=UPI000E0929D2|nr:replication protein [Lacticaseibacillus paracasei]RDG19890.1 replication protein [Lacticaseibacillus paracasei]
MADGGWIKVYRKIRQSFVWTDANQLKLWLLILMKANHAPSKFLFNGQEVSVTSGELVTGAHALAFEMNDGVRRDNQVSWRQVWRWVKKFENSGMLTIKSNTKYSVISISKWCDYQDNDNQVSIKRQSSVNQVSTNKKEEKEKKEKKEDSQQSRKREYADDSPEMIEAIYLWEKIKGNNPEHRKPNLQAWADDIRKMNQLDHRPFEKIHKMIDWCQIDTFWQTNILSAAKLRSKYDTMAAQANRKFSSGRRVEHTETKENWGYGVD